MSRERVGIAVVVLLALWITSCGQSGAGSNMVLSPAAFFQMVDALNDGFSYAYAPSIILKNGTYHVFFCSMALLLPTWDAVRYTTSTDGKTWSRPRSWCCLVGTTGWIWQPAAKCQRAASDDKRRSGSAEHERLMLAQPDALRHGADQLQASHPGRA